MDFCITLFSTPQLPTSDLPVNPRFVILHLLAFNDFIFVISSAVVTCLSVLVHTAAVPAGHLSRITLSGSNLTAMALPVFKPPDRLCRTLRPRHSAAGLLHGAHHFVVVTVVALQPIAVLITFSVLLCCIINRCRAHLDAVKYFLVVLNFHCIINRCHTHLGAAQYLC